MSTYRPAVRVGRADQLVERLVDDIVSGTYPPGTRLPPEPVLAERADVSRLTLREAVRSLRQRGVVRVEQGRGTFVNPPDEWSPFDAMVLAARAASDEGAVLAQQLTEVRRVVEVGIVAMAAQRRTDADITRMVTAIEAMRVAEKDADPVAFSRADIVFHDAVLEAADNPFAVALFQPIEAVLRRVRQQTAQDRANRDRAVEMHEVILDAVRRRSVRAAAAAMNQHLLETEEQTRHLGLDGVSRRRTDGAR